MFRRYKCSSSGCLVNAVEMMHEKYHENSMYRFPEDENFDIRNMSQTL
jgi:hypothetical protein